MRILASTILLLLYALDLSAQTEHKADWDWRSDGRSIVAFSPIGFVVAYGNFNPTASLEYEYIVNQKAGIAIRLPLAFGYEGPDQSDFGSGDYRHTTFYAAPGVRFHAPMGRHSSEFAQARPS